MITIKAFEFNYFQENTFVLYDDTKEAVIIDCGCLRPSEEKELSDFITENKLTVKHLLCTHLHLDHIFGNPLYIKRMVYPRRHTGSMWNNSLHPTNRHRHSDYRDISKKSRYRNSWSAMK